MSIRWHLSSLLARLGVVLLSLSRWYRGYWNFWRAFFPYAERNGLHILPVHYYSPIPNTQELPLSLWSSHRAPAGFDLRIDKSIEWLDTLSQKYGKEYCTLPIERTGNQEFFLNNEAFGHGEAECLYAILRELKPRKVIEIGSGFSTLLICQAIRANRHETGDQCEFQAIDPFPPSILGPLPPEITRLNPKPVQDISSDVFESLVQNDVLFIDSSHVARIGSDVVTEYLQIIPRLAPGVVVHIHDIFTPFEYPRRFVESRFFWNEQYMLEAFMTFNSAFEVILPLHAVSQLRPDRFRKFFPSSDIASFPPSSFWIRRLPRTASANGSQI